jgi:hypothetical protein
VGDAEKKANKRFTLRAGNAEHHTKIADPSRVGEIVLFVDPGTARETRLRGYYLLPLRVEEPPSDF